MATIRHKVAFKEVVKGSSLTKAMKVAGYSDETAKRTNKLTNTKGWQELIDKYISEEKLTQVLADGLGATRFQFMGLKEGNVEVEDHSVRHKYLETGLKIRGKLKESEGGQTNNYFINNLTVEQQRKLAAEIISPTEESEGESDRISNSDESTI